MHIQLPRRDLSFSPSVGPGIFSGRLSEEQRQLMAGNQDVPPPQGKYVLPGGGGAVTAQRLLQGVVG